MPTQERNENRQQSENQFDQEPTRANTQEKKKQDQKAEAQNRKNKNQ